MNTQRDRAPMPREYAYPIANGTRVLAHRIHLDYVSLTRAIDAYNDAPSDDTHNEILRLMHNIEFDLGALNANTQSLRSTFPRIGDDNGNA